MAGVVDSRADARLAKSSTRQELNDACRKRRQDGVDRVELSKKQHARRSLRSWTDGDGMICGQFRLEPVLGVPLLVRLEAETDRIRRAARRDGSVEPWEAHAADALVAMLGAEGAKARTGLYKKGPPAPSSPPLPPPNPAGDDEPEGYDVVDG